MTKTETQTSSRTTLQRAAILQHTATHVEKMPVHSAGPYTHYNMLQCTAGQCNTLLQYTAIHYNTPRTDANALSWAFRVVHTYKYMYVYIYIYIYEKGGEREREGEREGESVWL